MKAFPIEKFLTGVMIIFFSCLSLGAEETGEQCIRACNTEAKKLCNEKPKSDDPKDVKDFDDCVRGKKTDCIDRDQCSDRESSKDLRQACKEAFEKYLDASTKSKEACAAFDPSGGRSCQARAKSCESKIRDLSSPDISFGEDEGDGYGMLSEIALSSIYQRMGISNSSDGTLASQEGGICVKSIDRKARAQDKKEKDRERKELLEKIRRQRSKIVEYKEDLDKERDENAKEVAELEAENKKEILAKDKSISDRTSQVSREITEIGKRIRSVSAKITEQTQNLARVNFKHQTDMMSLTDEKINTKCKQEFESLKAGIVNSKLGSPSGASAEEQKQYAALAAISEQYKKQGIKGSGELKRMLIQVRKTCYESADVSRRRVKLENNQNIETIQSTIAELKKQMTDEKNSITTAQKEIETLKSQVDKEKQQAESEKLTKLDNLSKNLENHISNIEQKTKNLQDEIKELEAEIQNLALVQNFEVEDAYSEAMESIEKGNLTRKRALEACDCENKSSKDITCSQLRTDQESYDGLKVKSKTKTGK